MTNFRRLGETFLIALAILLPVASAKAQCISGDDFAICPAKDTIYLLDSTSLGALSLSERKTKWRIKLPHETEESFLGPVATEDSVVIYAGVPLTRVYAFDASTGKPSWRVEASSDEWISAGAYILFGDREHWEGVSALDGKTGKTVWHHTAGRPGDIAFLALSGHLILTNLFAIDAYSGQVLKRWPKDWDISAMSFAGPNLAIGTRYGGLGASKLAIYSWPGFQMLWSRRDDTWSKSNPRVIRIAGIDGDAKNLLVASYDAAFFSRGHATLEEFITSTGKRVWSKNIACDYMLLTSPIALAQGLPIFAMADTENSGVVEAFDAATGKQKWIAHTDQRLTGGPICDGQYCYFGSLSHEVLSIDVQSGAQSWLALPKE
jgi:outer membrane protein assembly factor BamB